MTAPRRALPGSGLVEIWHAPLTGMVAGHAPSDSYPGEAARLARLVRPEDRRDLLLRRSWLRTVLARYCGEPPAALRFAVKPKGRPYLPGLSDAPHFSLSRSRTHVALAVAAEPVGLDIEEAALDFDPVLLAETAFSQEDRAVVLAQPAGPERERSFVRIWTATEAVLKASGEGLMAADERIRIAARAQPVLHLDLSGRICAVALASGAPPQAVICTHDLAGEPLSR